MAAALGHAHVHILDSASRRGRRAIMSSKPRLTLRLLDKYYATVKDLQTYLDEILDQAPTPFTPGDTDSIAYANLVNTTVAGLKSEEKTLRRIQYAPPMSNMREVCPSRVLMDAH